MNQTERLIECILKCLGKDEFNSPNSIKFYDEGWNNAYAEGWNDAVDRINENVRKVINAWRNDQENIISRDYEAEIDTLKRKLDDFAYQNNIIHSALTENEKRIKEMSGVISAIKILADIEFENIKGDY